MMSKRRELTAVIASPSTPEPVRRSLRSAREIRSYASAELGLPNNGSYESYVDIGRPYIVWNVVATPEFSVQPLHWCFPFAGCVNYRGYFAQRSAEKFARRLAARGDDVAIGGVAAYSTLGHFNDPILSSMLGWSDIELAATIFHELTHQLIYVEDDSDFNEALATFVEEEGVRRWLRKQDRLDDLARFELASRREEAIVELMIRARADLDALYRERIASDSLRLRKQAVFDALRDRFVRTTATWAKPVPFAEWFAGQLNNAHLASVATYRRCVPGFAREFARAGAEFPRFYMRVRELARLSAQERELCTAPAAVLELRPRA